MAVIDTVRPLVGSLDPLPVGSVLQEFVVEGLVGIGGFGIVYQARDTQLNRTVAIKEYMPASMAARGEGKAITLRSESFSDDFNEGKNSFINEARMLARFKHPALIEVFRFWEQNGTAYMAMPFYKGATFKEALRRIAKVPSEASLKRILLPVLDALAHMHAEQVYHRDISPDNIMILEDGRPILLDLGAARSVESENSQAVTVLVKPGYAPIEQYAGDGITQQGPWTDIYGIGASAFFALTGKPPPPAASRVMRDSIAKLVDLKIAGYSTEFLSAIDSALAVRPDDRPQSVTAFKMLLGKEPILEAAEIIQPTQPQVAAQPDSLSNADDLPSAPKPIAKIAAVAACVLVCAIAAAWLLRTPSQTSAPTNPVKPAVANANEALPNLETPKAEPARPVALPVEPAKNTVTAKPAGAIGAEAIKTDIVKPTTATARLAIAPWGEVIVNGQSKGVTPPLKALTLPEGDYQIEVRNGDYPPFKTKLTLKAGQTAKIAHEFGASSAAPRGTK